MSFPTTRLTLINRLADESSEHDWSIFVDEYWRPVCRFAQRNGQVNAIDAEDVAADLFEILLRKDLLNQWLGDRRARLSTLLCAILRRILSNRGRSAQQRTADINWQQEDLQSIVSDLADSDQYTFERLWIDEVMQRSLDCLRDRYLEEGRGDHFRALYGRVCEDMSHQEVADYLGVEKATAMAWFRHAKDQLTNNMRQQVRAMVESYLYSGELEQEFAREWAELEHWLLEVGGLETAIRMSYAAMEHPS